MKKKLIGFAIALFILGMVGMAQATLIIDHGGYTEDIKTGLDWLDLQYTLGYSYNDVSSQLGVGDVFEGWRYASYDEVLTFWADIYGTDLISREMLVSGIDGITEAVGRYTGYTEVAISEYGGQEIYYIRATTGTPWITGANGPTSITTLLLDEVGWRRDYYFDPEEYNDYYSQKLANWLVRETPTNEPVPEPATIFLFGTGIGTLAVSSIRRKRTKKSYDVGSPKC